MLWLSLLFIFRFRFLRQNSFDLPDVIQVAMYCTVSLPRCECMPWSFHCSGVETYRGPNSLRGECEIEPPSAAHRVCYSALPSPMHPGRTPEWAYRARLRLSGFASCPRFPRRLSARESPAQTTSPAQAVFSAFR